MSEDPLVNVLMITYNHEKFIAKAIESVLMQQVNFKYEIVIGEDCSTDRTKDIVTDYQEKYRYRIKPLFHETNVGMHKNFKDAYYSCGGRYIALLEGDDYWTDPNKLHKQVDFLDTHPGCAICFHNVTVFDEDGKHKPLTHCPNDSNEIFTLENLLSGNFIHTCSVMFRRGLFGEFPEWFYKCKMGDWPLHILNAQHGDIGYINEVMAVYRAHSTGVWSKINRIEILHNTICAAEKIKQSLNQKHKNILENSITQWYDVIIENLIQVKDFKRASKYAKQCICRINSNINLPAKLFIKFKLISCLPSIFPFLFNIKKRLRL